jgi:hypothetical protein
MHFMKFCVSPQLFLKTYPFAYFDYISGLIVFLPDYFVQRH